MTRPGYTILVSIAMWVSILCLAGCQNFSPEDIGVDSTDNAILGACVKLDAMTTDSSASYRRLEVSQNVDITKIQPEVIQELTRCP
jgi:hypothetical protein